MSDALYVEKVQEAADFIREAATMAPRVGIILGSGLGALADGAEDAVRLPFANIPHFPSPTVQGHSGSVVVGQWRGVPVVFLQGRVHYYEGHAMDKVAFPARVLCKLGIETLILTNAAGGVNPEYRVGDLMAITDHLNLIGANPLLGPNIDEYGPRFLDLTEAYDKRCVAILQKAAQTAGITLRAGVYAALSGPTYETPAEVRMLHVMGADAVGMSTVPECIAARHMGVRVAGISCITNQAAGISPHPLSHDEVVEASNENGRKTTALLGAAIDEIAGLGKG